MPIIVILHVVVCLSKQKNITINNAKAPHNDTASGIILNVWRKYAKRITPKFRKALQDNDIECFGQVQKY